MRIEHFRIRSLVRKYDVKSGKFIVNISYETAPPKPTERVVGVAEAFGLGLDKWRKFVLYDNVELKISPQDIVYITGDSGSGKSVLLQALERDLREAGFTVANIADIKPIEGKPIVETVGKTLDEALRLLSLVGLNDAFLFLRNYEHLSEGQKYRYKIAKLIESGAQWLILDEFASTLDRDTAKIVAYNLQKTARKLGRAVLAATTHTDLLEDLAPSVHIHKRFGKEITVRYYPNKPAEECSITKEMRIEEGSYGDWKQLAEHHYRSHRIGNVRKIFRLMRNDELCGVIVYSYPPPISAGRKQAIGKISTSELNRLLSTISRVVIHPKYRGIGLGAKLVRETLPKAGTPYVELTAVMAKYNPFAEKAGMKKILERKPPKQALKIAEVLRKLGFNPHLLTSKKYVLAKLKSLSQKEIAAIKEAFMENPHIRFKKELTHEKLYGGTNKEYKHKIREASVEKLTQLIKVCGILMQTKAYLVWKSSWD